MRLRSAGLLLAVLLAACGGGGDGGGTDTGAGGGAEDLSVTIESPADGDEVATPFTIELSSSVELGPIDTGAHHVHIYFDDNEDEYEVVESSTFEVTGLSPGEHEIYASLRNADHSDTGVEAEVAVTVTGAGGGGADKEDKDDGGYDY